MSVEDYTPIFKRPIINHGNKKRVAQYGFEFCNTFMSQKTRHLHQVNVIVFGFGLIGRKLIEKIVYCRNLHKHIGHLQYNINAVFDSQGFIYNGDALGNPDPLPDGTLLQAIQWKQKQNSLRVFRDIGFYMNDFERMRLNLLGENTILVDCTNSGDSLQYVFSEHSKKGGGVVFSNKKPLCLSQQTFEHYCTGPRIHRFGYSATLGGSSQFLNAITNLISCGDTIWYLEGILSSFWNYILSNYKCGVTRFSDLCVQAHQKGLSMSDIREDLSGLDLARTLTILTRTLGWEQDMFSNGKIDSEQQKQLQCFYEMIPMELFWNSNMNIYDFMKHLRTLDESIDKYLTHIQSLNPNGSLRCIVKIDCETESLKINIESIDLIKSEYRHIINDMCGLKIYSDIYNKKNNESLFISGKGAGPEITVNGILMDLNRIANVMDNSF